MKSLLTYLYIFIAIVRLIELQLTIFDVNIIPNRAHTQMPSPAGDDLKLIDFGLSKFWEPSKKMEMRVPRPRGSLMHGWWRDAKGVFACCYEKMSSGTEILGFLFKVILLNFYHGKSL